MHFLLMYLRVEPRAEFLMHKVGQGLGQVGGLAVSIWQLQGWLQPTCPHSRLVSSCSWGEARPPGRGCAAVFQVGSSSNAGSGGGGSALM